MNFLPKDKLTQTALLLVVGLVLIVVVKSMEKQLKPLTVKVLIGVVVVGILYLVYHLNSTEEFFNEEGEDEEDNVSVASSEPVEPMDAVNPPLFDNFNPQEMEKVEPSSAKDMNQQEAKVPESKEEDNKVGIEACVPKDTIQDSSELLPGDSQSKWADFNVPGMDNKNFLDAGAHVGIDTVGQSLRNANRQLRSEPPNPQVQVSPWLQSTIGPDNTRRPLEIGNGPL